MEYLEIEGRKVPQSTLKDLCFEDDESTIVYSISGKRGKKNDLSRSEIPTAMDNFFLQKDCKVGKILQELEIEFAKLKKEIPALSDAGMRVEFKIPRGYNTALEHQINAG